MRSNIASLLVDWVRGRRRMMIHSVAALATIALVINLGGWLGSLLDPMALVSGRASERRRFLISLGRDQDANAIATPDLRGHIVVGEFIFADVRASVRR